MLANRTIDGLEIDGLMEFSKQQKSYVLSDVDQRGNDEKQAPSHTVVYSSFHIKRPETWLGLLRKRWLQGMLGVLIGCGLLVAIAHFVDIPTALAVFHRNVTTPRGALLALATILAFFLAFCIRALRWKLFLNVVGRVSIPSVIALFLSGVFLNFILPVRAGELVKSVVLKRNFHMPFSQSLPTITMDKVQDLLPAFFIAIMVPLLGVQLDGRFWYVVGVANVGLLFVILLVILAAWRRSLMVRVLHAVTRIVPRALRQKVAEFAINFVDALLLSAKQPRILLLATLLTALAVVCDGLYNYFAFWTIGYPITLGQAILGYMIFNIFYILPNPPGQVGSNEVVGLLIFGGLMHVPADKVIAMMLSFHLWTGLMMCVTGLTCLSSLGVKFSTMMKPGAENKLSQ
jgi:uncharacterized protein (TIRG00374 family)